MQTTEDTALNAHLANVAAARAASAARQAASTDDNERESDTDDDSSGKDTNDVDKSGTMNKFSSGNTRQSTPERTQQ